MPPGVQLPQNLNFQQQPEGLLPAGQWWQAGAAPAIFRGQPLWGGGADQFGDLEHAGSVEARTISADSTKRSMRLWQDTGASFMFILRGGLFVPPTSDSESAHLLRHVVDPNKRVLEMITPPMAKIDMDAFTPPVEPGTTAVARAPEVHFQTFVNVLIMIIKQGEEEAATGASQSRREFLIVELRAMATALNEYMTTHFNSLLPKQEVVRRRVLFEANRDINEFFGGVFDAAAPVKRKFPTSAPPEGACPALTAPAFTHLRELTARGSHSLLGKMDIGLEVPRPGGTSAAAKAPKRKMKGGGAQPPAARPRSDGAAQVWSFVDGLEQDGTPAGACYFAWRGLQCKRKNCSYGHGPFAQNGTHMQGPPPQTPMQQPQQYQQPQQHQVPQQRQQRQQQQQQRTASPSAVAKFSFSHGQQGRGGGTHGRSGAGGGRGPGSN